MIMFFQNQYMSLQKRFHSYLSSLVLLPERVLRDTDPFSVNVVVDMDAMGYY
jgi:hypothetical protein